MEALNQLGTILTGLGVDSTVWVQLGLFLFTFLLLNNLVFKKYQTALQQRHDKTLGSDDLLKQLALETQEIQAQYEKRARQVNEQIKAAYDIAMSEATKKQSEIMDSARKQTSESIKQSREQISVQVREARALLQKELPSVSALIANKLMGKETV